MSPAVSETFELFIIGRLSLPDAPDAKDLRPADLLYSILGRVVIFLEFPLIRPGYPPDRPGRHERLRERTPREAAPAHYQARERSMFLSS
jgi:hypothetical protein